MSAPQPERPTARTAADICGHFQPSPGARKLLSSDPKPGTFLAALLEQGHYVDALRFVAHALPTRETVWWACLCVRHTLGESPSPVAAAALHAAIAWVLEPTEEHRKAAQDAARAAGNRVPAGAAAAAAAGTRSPVRAAKLATAAVLLAAAHGTASDRSLHYRQFVGVGVDVDQGIGLWGAARSAGR